MSTGTGVSGYCSENQPRWTNVEGFGCFVFQYSGCGGNANNFMTEKKCLQHCKSNLSFVSESEGVAVTIRDGGKTILHIDRKVKIDCEYEHDRFIINKNKQDDGLWRFSADRGSG
eukprot:TRINITY_DN19156_c0_g1_i1.p1 TRINITY_DN19156_c0_g1~~TRINITY_DN19156_c0_g1_i1.p1  ORF type:complete len:115 (-),score=18.20 TRINITY_DN19156_c0_g1_i1:17-361(-)